MSVPDYFDDLTRFNMLALRERLEYRYAERSTPLNESLASLSDDLGDYDHVQSLLGSISATGGVLPEGGDTLPFSNPHISARGESDTLYYSRFRSDYLHPLLSDEEYHSRLAYVDHLRTRESLPINSSHRSHIESSRTNNAPAVIVEYPSGFAYRSYRPSQPPPSGGGRRGLVSGFSQASQRRLRDKLIRVDWNAWAGVKNAPFAPSIFLTLTYPDTYPDFWTDYKNHLRMFQKRIVRVFEKRGVSISAVWKLEYQDRGAPHFHCILFFHGRNSPHSVRIALLARWCRIAWSEIADNGSSGSAHEKYGADIIGLYSDGSSSKIMNYILKYLGKDSFVPSDNDGVIQTGRMWGIWNKKIFSLCP